TITRVRHVPDLKRNLISLSTLEVNGCKYSGEGGVMKNIQVSFIVDEGHSIRTRDALDYIHSDLCGSSPVTSRGGKKIKQLRIDNGLEFCGESFNALCQKYGITRHHTLVRTPQQNGVAERMNMTIIERVRCMHSHANLDKDFWVEATTTATYLITVLLIDLLMAIFQKYYGQVISLIILILDFWMFNGYRVWCPDPKYRKIIHSRDVTFNEDVIINSGKDFVPPHNVDNNHTEFVAMEEEVESLHKNETWELVKLPKEKCVISCKWLFKVKDCILGVESNRYKARVLLSIVTLQDLELEQLDVKTPFLRGHLEEEIYVEQPKGFKVPGKEDHTGYISKVLKKFNMISCKPIPTPLAPHFKLSSHECPKSEEDKEDMSRVSYSSAVDSLMYTMVCTRPIWPMSLVYNIGLSFEKGRASPNRVVGYVDSDYASDLDARKSLSSYIFSHCGSAISWYSSLQAITALSITEAGYISSTEGVKEAIWL
nr:retrovirus-related Pol polyprotein from transposon TNT 1-94 [Tanacetum cinerariifolium]